METLIFEQTDKMLCHMNMFLVMIVTSGPDVLVVLAEGE